MKVTECLNTEHGVFLTQLGKLEQMLDEQAPPEAIRAVTLTIAEPVEQHRAAEERILYPAILREFGADFPPIRVMEAEHQEIERCIREVASAEGDVSAIARRFIEVLRQHIAKEIKVLFPMAEQRITSADLEQMACQCLEHHHHAAGVAPCHHGQG